MYEAGAKRAELQPDEQATMTRLASEVRQRLDEMAAIAIRALGIDASGIVAKFAPVPVKSDAPVTDVEIIELPDGTSGCWVTTSDGGGFCESPCGSGPA